MVANRLAVIEKIQPNKGGDLVVAAAPGAQLAAEFGTRDVDESAFEGAVHVFIRLQSYKLSGGDRGPEGFEGRDHAGKLGAVEVAGGRERGRVRPGALQIVGPQLPVKMRRLA